MKNLNAQEVQKLFISNLPSVKKYIKTGKVSVRPAIPGEKIVTITSSGKETENTAKESQVVVRNLATTAQEEYVVSEDKFFKNYVVTGFDYEHVGHVVADPLPNPRYGFLYEGEGLTFTAPWGEDMVLNPGDLLATPNLDNLDSEPDIYRIDATELSEAYKLADEQTD